jgi:hypothetical protein
MHGRGLRNSSWCQLVSISAAEDAPPPEPAATDTRPVRRCEGCGERAGSISAGTGRPLVRDRESGRFFHLSCKPGAVRSGEFLERMGAGL